MRNSCKDLITIKNQTFETRNFSIPEAGIYRSHSKQPPSVNWTDGKMPSIGASRQFRSASRLSFNGDNTGTGLLTTVDTSQFGSRFSINDSIVVKNRKLLPTPLIMRKHNEYSHTQNLDRFTSKSPDIKKILKNMHQNSSANNSLDAKVIKNNEI
jgi:hypothetical protein